MKYLFLLISTILLFSCTNEFRDRVMMRHIERMYEEGKLEEAKLSVDSLLSKSPENEMAWASNSWYKDGWMNSIMGGIGFRF